MRRNTVWNGETEPGSPSKNKQLLLTVDGHHNNVKFTPFQSEKRHQITRNGCLTYFKEFTSNTSLHGLKYVGERKRSVVERVWWTAMFVLSAMACGHLIFKVWTKWEQSPVIVSFAESSTPVWQIPFPAITICSENKARQTVYNFTTMYHKYKSLKEPGNFSDEEVAKYQAVSLVCDDHLVKGGNKTTDYTSVAFIKKVAPQFDEMMWQCKWKTLQSDCKALFSPIITEEGSCFTFNMLDAEELFRKEVMHQDYDHLNHGKKSEGWNLDGGYPKNLPLDTYPVRGTGSGAKAGLTILMRAYDYDLDYLCRGPVQGFKILLHTPTEVPRLSQQYFRIPLEQEVVIAIKPNMMTTSEGLRLYAPERRQCYFPFERRLKYFKVYTQQNCELECLTNYTMQVCDCVTFAMPRDPSMPICSSGSRECALTAQDDLLIKEIKSGLSVMSDATQNLSQKLMMARERVASHCDCLPACTAISYDAETSQADFNWRRIYQAFKVNHNETPGIQMSRCLIYFKESQFITSRRSELYGMTDFMANCGGLLGLFLGFSILSLVEVIYFITLRLFCNVKNKVIKKNNCVADCNGKDFQEIQTTNGLKDKLQH